jgi:hypothetical protein
MVTTFVYDTNWWVDVYIVQEREKSLSAEQCRLHLPSIAFRNIARRAVVQAFTLFAFLITISQDPAPISLSPHVRPVRLNFGLFWCLLGGK